MAVFFSYRPELHYDARARAEWRENHALPPGRPDLRNGRSGKILTCTRLIVRVPDGCRIRAANVRFRA